MDFKKLATQYKDELMNHILPFWLECSQDHEYGGYFTCLDRQGNVFIIRKSKFPQNPKRSVRFSGKRTKRSVQKRKARNTQKAETKVL